MSDLQLIWALTFKELKVQARSPLFLMFSFFLSLLILVIFNVCFSSSSEARELAAPGIFWIALLFPSSLQLGRSLELERTNGTLEAIILSPVDRGWLFIGKFLGNWVLLLSLASITLVWFLLLFNVTFSTNLVWMVLVVALTCFGIAAVGTVLSGLSSSVRLAEVCLPAILFPILIPLLIAAVSATRAILFEPTTPLSSSIRLLAGFDVIFVAAGFLVFGKVFSESE